jgi:6-phosphogluconate dehydrogenase
VLDDIRRAFLAAADLPHLLLDEALGARVATDAASLQAVVQAAITAGIPAPAFASALGYLDALGSPRLPANLIQAQRDFFGDHTYERVDAVGTFHTEWSRA